MEMSEMSLAWRYVAAVVSALMCLVLLLLLSGCNMYNIQRCEGNVCSTAEIKSMRKFKNIAFKYNGEARTFELQAGEVGTDVSAMNTLASVILMQAQQNQGDDQ
jgi:hypothetical protein